MNLVGVSFSTSAYTGGISSKEVSSLSFLIYKADFIVFQVDIHVLVC
jgi:hypothetical protein